MAVLTLPEAKQQLNVLAGDTSLDEELGAYIAAVDEVVERETRQAVSRRTVTERHDTARQDSLFLRLRPVVQVASITQADGTRTWDVGQVYLDADAGVLQAPRGQWFAGTVEVTYEAGYAADDIPDNFKLAARILLQHLWETQRSRFGAARSSALEAVPGRGYAVPNAVLELLGDPGPVFA